MEAKKRVKLIPSKEKIFLLQVQGGDCYHKKNSHRTQGCLSYNYNQLNKEEQNTLEEDALENGRYQIAKIEDHVEVLNNEAKYVKDESGDNNNLEAFKKENGLIKPIQEVRPDAEFEETSYHLRASEFGDQCYIARLISKLDRDKIEELGFDLDESEVNYNLERYENIRRAGELLHQISQGDQEKSYIETPVQAQIQENGRPVPRKLEGDNNTIVISGHIDAAFLSETEVPFIIDLKRGKTPRKSYMTQMRFYLLGLKQQLELETEYGLADIITHSNYPQREGLAFPRHNIIKLNLNYEDFPKETQEIYDNLDKDREHQKELLHDQFKFNSNRQLWDSTLEEKPCYPTTEAICDFLASEETSGIKLEDLANDDLKL